MQTVFMLPPTIQLLLDAKLPNLTSARQGKQHLKKYISELRRQAKGTSENIYVDKKHRTSGNDLWITVSDSLNPAHPICHALECRVARAQQFARTVGLYADVITLSDPITPRFLLNKRFEDDEYEEFIALLSTLKVLEPLMREGVVRFRKAIHHYCRKCSEELTRQIEDAAKELFSKTKSEVTFELMDEFIVTNMGRLYDPPIRVFQPITNEMHKQLSSGVKLKDIGREKFGAHLHEAVRSILLDLNAAAITGSSLFSASRLDMLSLNALDKVQSPKLHDVERWEQLRSIDLPWIKALSTQQIVDLRKAADRALPRFREKILHAISAPKVANPTDVIKELREEAVEVEAEIRSINLPGESRFRNVVGTLGITMSVYGFASGFVPPALALGSLITLLGLLHTSAHNHAQDLAKLRSRPGYVLLKARELLQHGSGSGHDM